MADEQQSAPIALCSLASLLQHTEQPVDRREAGTVAQHHVENDDGRRGITGLGQDPRIAHGRIDHRMRPTLGELVVAHVDQPMSSYRVTKRDGALDRHIRRTVQPGRQQGQLRLVAEGTAGKHAANIALVRLAADQRGARLGQQVRIGGGVRRGRFTA